MSGTQSNSACCAPPTSSRHSAASRKITLLLPFLLVLFQYSPTATAKTAGTLASRLGVAVQKSGTNCLYTHNASLATGSPLTIVLLSPPQSTMKAEVVKSAAESCSTIDKSDTDLRSYEIRPASEGQIPATPAIAISGLSGRFQTRGKYVTADINRDGQPEFFRFCASSDGLHLTVWSGSALHGKRRWHQYYYLGYDVEPNCTSAETRISAH